VVASCLVLFIFKLDANTNYLSFKLYEEFTRITAENVSSIDEIKYLLGHKHNNIGTTFDF